MLILNFKINKNYLCIETDDGDYYLLLSKVLGYRYHHQNGCFNFTIYFEQRTFPFRTRSLLELDTIRDLTLL